MFCQRYDVPTTPTSIASLIQNQLPANQQAQVGVSGFRSDVVIQSINTNGNPIYIGDQNNQEAFVDVGGSASFFKAELNDMFILGTAGDQVSILLVN
jgi:hypothetical protein